MRHKYETQALVLMRTPINEAGMLVTLLTEELGLVRAIATGVRKSGAKLAAALQTFDECEVTLVRGKEAWRLSGAVLIEGHFRLLDSNARARAGRVSALLMRLVHGEGGVGLFSTIRDFVRALPELSHEEQDAAEIVAALSLLRDIGVDAGTIPVESYAPETLRFSLGERQALITRVNRGIVASGL